MASFAKIVGGSLALGLFSGFVQPAEAAVVYGLTDNSNTIFRFDTTAPSDVKEGRFIDGLANGDIITAIDFRPSTNELYGLGKSSRLYKINPETGDATQVGSGRFSPLLNGTRFGFDFNPQADRIRIVSNGTQQNLNASPNDASVIVQGNLAYAPGDVNSGRTPSIVGSAYSDNFAGTGSTMLYGIDTVLDVLVKQVPGTGQLTTIGVGLGVDATDRIGFDILSVNGDEAFAALTPKSITGFEAASSLYRIDLATGLATNLGTIGGGEFIGGIAVLVPEPASLSVLALGALALAGRRRRA